MGHVKSAPCSTVSPLRGRLEKRQAIIRVASYWTFYARFVEIDDVHLPYHLCQNSIPHLYLCRVPAMYSAKASIFSSWNRRPTN